MSEPIKKFVVRGDILKSEADRNSRVVIEAPKGTKLGDLVEFKPRKQKLVALSDEHYGKVLVQPHNCVINLDCVNLGTEKADKLIKEGDTYGIKYISPSTDNKTTQDSQAVGG